MSLVKLGGIRGPGQLGWSLGAQNVTHDCEAQEQPKVAPKSCELTTKNPQSKLEGTRHKLESQVEALKLRRRKRKGKRKKRGHEMESNWP